MKLRARHKRTAESQPDTHESPANKRSRIVRQAKRSGKAEAGILHVSEVNALTSVQSPSTAPQPTLLPSSVILG